LISGRKEGGKRLVCDGECEEECMLVANDVLGLLTPGPTHCPIDQAALRFLCLLNQGPARSLPWHGGRDTQFHHPQGGRSRESNLQ
jgi:hypothetical protein